MLCLITWKQPHIIKLIAYLVLRYYWVILPLSLDMQGFMAIDIGFLKFFTFCARGGLQRISPSSICTHSLPYPTPSKYISSIKNPIPSGQPPCQPLPAGCYSEPGQETAKQPITYTQAHKHARKRKRISSSYNIIVAKPA